MLQCSPKGHGIKKRLLRSARRYRSDQQGDSRFDLFQSNCIEQYPLSWFNAAEAAFLRAEWELRWGDMGNAQSLYEQAIKLSFEERGVSGAETYVTSNARPAKYIDPMGEYTADNPASDITIAWEAGNTEEVRERNLERIITQNGSLSSRWVSKHGRNIGVPDTRVYFRLLKTRVPEQSMRNTECVEFPIR